MVDGPLPPFMLGVTCFGHQQAAWKPALTSLSGKVGLGAGEGSQPPPVCIYPLLRHFPSLALVFLHVKWD